MSKFPEYENLDGLALAKLVRDGEISASEILEECITRIERFNPQLGAVVHTNYDRARQASKSNGGDGPFSGVPFLLKDLGGEDAGEPCTGSCALLKDYRAPEDSPLVERFKQAGLNIVGRTNTPEFGIYGVTEPALRGPARNPWDLNHTPGGSSGGASSAVAARLVPIAHASDGGGSIRIPAAHAGLVGLKPTRARNPMGWARGERWGGFVCEHVVSWSVRDSAAILDATHGALPGAPYTAPAPEGTFLEAANTPPGKLKIAFSTGALFGDEIHPDNVRAVEAAAKLAEELGHEVVEARPDFDRQTLVKAYLMTVATGVANAIQEAGEKAGRTPKASDFEEPTWLMGLIGSKIRAGEYEWFKGQIQKNAFQIGRFFTEYDVFLTATAAKPPVPIGSFVPTASERVQMKALRAVSARSLMLMALDKMAAKAMSATPNTMLFNQTGQPGISLPLAWNAQGLPIGTQWVGRFGDEVTLFRLAAQLEEAQPWKDRKPPLLSSTP